MITILYIETLLISDIRKVSANADLMRTTRNSRDNVLPEYSFNISFEFETWTLFAFTDTERISWMKELTRLVKRHE
jgi:hypothetical protein